LNEKEGIKKEIKYSESTTEDSWKKSGRHLRRAYRLSTSNKWGFENLPLTMERMNKYHLDLF